MMMRYFTALFSLVSNFVKADLSHDGKVLSNALPLTADMPCRHAQAEHDFLLLANRCFSAAFELLQDSQGEPLPNEFGEFEMSVILGATGTEANKFWLDVACFMGARPGRLRNEPDWAQKLFTEVVDQRLDAMVEISFEARLSTLRLLCERVRTRIKQLHPNEVLKMAA